MQGKTPTEHTKHQRIQRYEAGSFKEKQVPTFNFQFLRVQRTLTLSDTNTHIQKANILHIVVVEDEYCNTTASCSIQQGRISGLNRKNCQELFIKIFCTLEVKHMPSTEQEIHGKFQSHCGIMATH